jgi:hypothetical protein
MAEPLPEDTLARLQQRVFEQLSKQRKDPVLAEMAREILAGKLTLREAAAIGPYAEALFSAGHASVSRIIAMPEEERDELVRRGVAALDQPDDPQDEPDYEPDDELSDAHRAGPARRDEPEDEFTDSIMVGVAKRRDQGPSTEPPQRARWTRRWQ